VNGKAASSYHPNRLLVERVVTRGNEDEFKHLLNCYAEEEIIK
jgi:hypothetical protein